MVDTALREYYSNEIAGGWRPEIRGSTGTTMITTPSRSWLITY